MVPAFRYAWAISGVHVLFGACLFCASLQQNRLDPRLPLKSVQNLCSDRSKTNYILLDSTIRNLIESFQLYGNYGYIQQGFLCRTKNICAVCCTATWIKQLTGHKHTCKYKTMWLPNSHQFPPVTQYRAIFPRCNNKTKFCVQSKL
jgi:hypothetical protein